MATFYGMQKLGHPSDWELIVGTGKWKVEHSAYELAHAWHGASRRGIPAGIARALDGCGVPELSRLTLEIGFVEKPTFLDTATGPSMTDIMGYARNTAGDPVILCVEGKANEPFGLPVNVWVRGNGALPGAEPTASRRRRLEYLAERLGLPVDCDSAIYYQLLHRTVSAVMEASLHGAACAVLVVHSFSDTNPENWNAYSAFLAALGSPPPTKEVVTGPIALGRAQDTRLYALWHSDQPRGKTAADAG